MDNPKTQATLDTRHRTETLNNNLVINHYHKLLIDCCLTPLEQ